MYGRATARSTMALVRDEALWRYDLAGRSERSGFRREVMVIETPAPVMRPVGVLIHPHKLWDGGMFVRLFEAAGVPLLAVTPGVLRYLDRTGAEYAARDGEEFKNVVFELGETHPVYDTAPDRLPRVGRPYAWYLRVPDLPAFIQHIAPVLERRLATSAQGGYTGDLTISRYRDGLRLRFTEGRLRVEAWTPDRIEAGDAFFPDLTFLQLLFGYRSVADLEHAFADCLVRADHARVLLPILFPKGNAEVWSGG